MMRRIIPWIAMGVSLACLSSTATAEEYVEYYEHGKVWDPDKAEYVYPYSICADRTSLFVMHPGNTEDNLKRMRPERPSGFLNSGDFVLHSIAREGETETVRGLLEAGLEPNPFNDHGLTPLHVAAALGRTDIVTLLLESGADPNLTSKNEHYPCLTTPLHWAAYLGHADIAGALINAGADRNAAAKDGSTPMDWGNLGGHVDVVLAMLTGRTSDSGQGSKKIEAPE